LIGQGTRTDRGDGHAVLVFRLADPTPRLHQVAVHVIGERDWSAEARGAQAQEVDGEPRQCDRGVHAAKSSASFSPGSSALMKVSPTRKPCTPWLRMCCTSSRVLMPLSVTTRQSAGMRALSARVVPVSVWKVFRLRLLIPTMGGFRDR